MTSASGSRAKSDNSTLLMKVTGANNSNNNHHQVVKGINQAKAVNNSNNNRAANQNSGAGGSSTSLSCVQCGMTFASREQLRGHQSTVHMLPCCWNDCKQSFINAPALRKHLDSHVAELENDFTMTAVMIVRQAAMRGNREDIGDEEDEEDEDEGADALSDDEGAGMIIDDGDNSSLVDPSQLLDNHLSSQISDENLI